MTQGEMMAALDGSVSGKGSTEAEHASFIRARDGIRDVFARLEAAEAALVAADAMRTIIAREQHISCAVMLSAYDTARAATRAT